MKGGGEAAVTRDSTIVFRSASSEKKEQQPLTYSLRRGGRDCYGRGNGSQLDLTVSFTFDIDI
jgi:hypothetical protein